MKHKSILIPAAFAAMAATASAAPMERSEVLLKSASNIGMVRTPVCGISGVVAPQRNAALQAEMAAAEKPIVGFEATGTMKEDAYRGLCRMPDGEIRHYGRDVRTGARVYASSRDDGRNWIECRAKTKWEDAMVRGGRRIFATASSISRRISS